ncbi:unnamed protein product [Clonostachys byssicola]|uniref:NADP-dependent oxidoreductase domain-containing protein n=1 Tax=Clonostachys byssicola TaxID=160290 RepID=A0A9N9UKK3_9HYPO|nr:unnamed protein product [Clonostachys byssicola]
MAVVPFHVTGPFTTFAYNPPALSLNTTWTLNSGYEAPVIGYGTYLIPENITAQAVGQAIQYGFRHIDCATYYGNEAQVAIAMNQSGIPRQDLFFTSKAPPPNNYNRTKNALERTLEVTGLDYLDLYLIHTPDGTREDRLGSWKALAEAVEQKKVRSIGVSNFELDQLEELEAWIKETEKKEGKTKAGTLSVIQVEMHPWVNQTDVVDWSFQRNIQVQGWSPLVRAERFNETMLQNLAKKHSKSPAQILLRWSLQKGYTPLPKAVQPRHMEENIDVFNFELDSMDMAVLFTGVDEPYSGN